MHWILEAGSEQKGQTLQLHSPGLCVIFRSGCSFSSPLATENSDTSSLAPHLAPNKEQKWESENKMEQMIILPVVLEDVLLKLLDFDIKSQWEMVAAAYLEVFETRMEKYASTDYKKNLTQECKQTDLIFESFSNLLFFSVKNTQFIQSSLYQYTHLILHGEKLEV